MALLLAMFQKMKLVREKNQLTLDVVRLSSRKSRITKNIERTQKRYTSLFSQLESQAKMAQNSFTNWVQGSLGLGGAGLNPLNFAGMGGMSMFIANVMGNGFAKTGWTDDKGNIVKGSDKIAQAMWDAQMSGGIIENKKDGKFVDGQEYKAQNGNATFSKEDYGRFQAAISQAQQMQQMAQWQAQQMNTQYQNNVSIWLDAAKSQLEAEQDAALEPLNYEDTMIDLEKEQKETRLKLIQEEIQSYDQLVSQEAKDAAPKFGLG